MIRMFVIIFIMIGCLSGCISQLNNLNKKSSDIVVADDRHERLGDSYLAQGKLQLAMMEYDKYLRIDPNNNNVRYKKGLVFVDGKMNEDAVR
ncbi:tetratricopeptide repeat protein, partial [Candidatus Parcubacteria bacterium]|nr:tetratricopeptide repeat protein [Candidatus Parcubacteria bacterium]